jgi:CheY-like chemotaxis protein
MRTPDSGRGAEFWFEVPFPRVESAEVARAQTIREAETMTLGPASVLVADDVEVNREIISIMLESLGIRVDQVDSGEAALRAAESADYDLIIMDVHMPGMGGLAAIKRIRQLDGKGQGPVLVWSANSTSDEVEEYLACGAQDILEKPLRHDRLIEVLSRYLSA